MSRAAYRVLELVLVLAVVVLAARGLWPVIQVLRSESPGHAGVGFALLLLTLALAVDAVVDAVQDWRRSAGRGR